MSSNCRQLIRWITCYSNKMIKQKLLFSQKVGNLVVLFVFSLIMIGASNVFAEIEFEDVTETSGISYSGGSWGSAWGNLNEDDWPDLWTNNHGTIPKLYLNNGNGTLTDIVLLAGFNLKGADTHGSSWADYDNDGDQDLIVLSGAQRGEGEGPNFLLVNNNGTLQNKASILGLDYPLGRGRTPLWFDYDKDGLLDVILANAIRPDQQAPTALFHQTTTGFEDVTVSSGLLFEKDVGSVQISNLAGDGDMELLFMVPSTQGIFEIGKLPFVKIQNNLNLPNMGSQDFVIGDFNGDLLQDIFLVRMDRNNAEGILDFEALQDEKFLINTKSGFSDKAILSGFDKPTACSSVVAGDFDNDMDLDIYSVCSFSFSNKPNMLYENNGDGTFVLVPQAGGAEGTSLGVGDSVTTVDYDADGFLDLFVTNGYGPSPYSDNGPSQLFRNLGNNNHWIEIDLIGTISNRDGIGSSVQISTGDITQLREQANGMHHRSQNHQRIHFGLGQNSVIDSIVIFWPSGLVHEIKQVSADQILKIVEPSTPIPPKHQTSLGLEPQKVICKEGMVLTLKKSDSSAACVKLSSLDILLQRGWSVQIKF